MEQGKKGRWWYRQVLTMAALCLDSEIPDMNLKSDLVSADIVSCKSMRKDPLLREAILLRDPMQAPGAVEGKAKLNGLHGRWCVQHGWLQKTATAFFNIFRQAENKKQENGTKTQPTTTEKTRFNKWWENG